MAIRITQNQISGNFQSNVQSIYSKLAKSQQQLSDGRRITAPSDDPFGAGQVLGFDRQLADLKRFQANTSESMGFLDAADSALDTVTSALQAIREKATQAASDTNDLSARAAIATEIQQLKEVVRDGLNAQFGDTYLFSGTSGSAEPFPLPANAYVGNGNVISRRVGQGQSVDINVPGDLIAGPNGTNVLDMIDTLVADVTAGNQAGISTGLGQVISFTNTALDVRTSLGATASRLEVTQNRLALTEERLISARTDVADVDATEAYVQFTQQQSMYEAALAAGTRIMQTSILDFI
jgi:flagellar hook-associated protein 3 FlgL